MILITGIAGFIGTNLAEKLLISGEHVIGIDNFTTGDRDNIDFLKKIGSHPENTFSFFEGDITKKNVWDIISNNTTQCEHIYHLACPTGVPNCEKLGIEMLTTSVLGTLHVLEFARKNKSKIVFTSSSEVYGDPAEFPQKETYVGNVNSVGFRSPYEEGKRTAESLILSYSGVHNVFATIARLFNTYGPYMKSTETRVIPRFLNQARLNKPLTIYGTGNQTRTFCYVSDIVSALMLLMKTAKKNEIYNVGNDKEITIVHLAKLIKKITHSNSKIVYKDNAIADHKRRLPDISKIMGLGWQQKISFNEGLEKTIISIQNRIQNRPLKK